MADKKLTEEEVADLKEAFAMFDINGDGKLSFPAMTAAKTETAGLKKVGIVAVLGRDKNGCDR